MCPHATPAPRTCPQLAPPRLHPPVWHPYHRPRHFLRCLPSQLQPWRAMSRRETLVPTATSVASASHHFLRYGLRRGQINVACGGLLGSASGTVHMRHVANSAHTHLSRPHFLLPVVLFWFVDAWRLPMPAWCSPCSHRVFSCGNHSAGSATTSSRVGGVGRAITCEVVGPSGSGSTEKQKQRHCATGTTHKTARTPEQEKARSQSYTVLPTPLHRPRQQAAVAW